MESHHVFTIMTLYLLPTDSAGRAERDACFKEYFEKLVMKNQYVIHEQSMIHYYTDDSREFVIIDEYASWDDIDKANDRVDELAKLAWPDSKKRQEFFNKFNSFFSYHKDAIYGEVPGMTK